MTAKKTKQMPVEKLGEDTAGKMPPVSPQFKTKLEPDSDGLYRDRNRNVFDPSRHAMKKDGTPVLTPRGFFKMKPKEVAPKPAVQLPEQLKDKEESPAEEKEVEHSHGEDLQIKDMQTAQKTSEDDGGSKKKIRGDFQTSCNRAPLPCLLGLRIRRMAKSHPTACSISHRRMTGIRMSRCKVRLALP